MSGSICDQCHYFDQPQEKSLNISKTHPILNQSTAKIGCDFFFKLIHDTNCNKFLLRDKNLVDNHDNVISQSLYLYQIFIKYFDQKTKTKQTS